MKRLKKIGVDTQIKDKEKLLDNYNAAILSLRSLERTSENYQEIIDRLSVLLEETTAEQKQ